MSEECVVTKIHPDSRASTICCSAAMSDGNILQMPKKLIHRLITEIKVAVGCVVQLRTLSIVKISSRSQMKNCSQRLRRCMEELYLGMN